MAVTLRQARQALGYALDDLAFYTATSGTSATVVLGELISAASGASDIRYGGRWIFNANTGYQRRVRTGGYAPSTGTLTSDPPWPITPVANDRIELTSLFPCGAPPFSADATYASILNTAGGKLVFPDWISPAIVPAADSYSLFTAPWLDRPERLGWPFPQPDGSPYPLLMEPAPFGSGWVSADWRGPRLQFSVGLVRLELDVPYTTGTSGSLRLNVMRPVTSWVGNGGTFADSTVGLVAEGDTLQIAQQDLVDVAIWEAIKILAKRSTSSATGRWADKLEEAEKAARAVRWFDDLSERAKAPAPVPVVRGV